MMTFIEKIDLLRRIRGYSERALAAELKINPSAVSRWRSRKSLPRHAIVKRIADLFGITADALADNKPLPGTALTNPAIRAAATSAKNMFPQNHAAGQLIFEKSVAENLAKREKAETADFLRARAKTLKQEASLLEKKASELDSK